MNNLAAKTRLTTRLRLIGNIATYLRRVVWHYHAPSPPLVGNVPLAITFVTHDGLAVAGETPPLIDRLPVRDAVRPRRHPSK